ncbi:hypothetical protein KSF78_0003955 [Schistosoma japonicum]|nr:hypothetical protein KSF78_0003955 [Schistosoma japonicum]
MGSVLKNPYYFNCQSIYIFILIFFEMQKMQTEFRLSSGCINFRNWIIGINEYYTSLLQWFAFYNIIPLINNLTYKLKGTGFKINQRNLSLISLHYFPVCQNILVCRLACRFH